VTAIIFCVALSAYDLMLAEDDEMVRVKSWEIKPVKHHGTCSNAKWQGIRLYKAVLKYLIAVKDGVISVSPIYGIDANGRYEMYCVALRGLSHPLA
jgi:hypothetical protein